ncbi:hypothetical protein ACF0H5_000559 [Mactra antiquata]
MNGTTIISSHDGSDALGMLNPSYVFICVLVTFGIPGNILSIIVYGFQLKSAIGRYAIISLAFCDVINCVLSIPIELYIMSNYWAFENSALCKMSRFLTYAMNNSSALILLAIAVERHRAICSPHKPKIQNSCILRACLLLIIIGILLALPSLWIYGIQTDNWYEVYPIDNTGTHLNNISNVYHPYINLFPLTNKTKYQDIDVQIETKRCLIDDKYRQTWFAYSHFGFVTISSVIVLLLLLSYYIRIGRKIAGLRNRRYSTRHEEEECFKSSIMKKTKASLVLFLITIGFEFTVFPFIVVTNIRFFTKHDWFHNLSLPGKMTYHFFLRSYYFNNAVNPFIYCISSSNFRSALMKILKRIKDKTMSICCVSNNTNVM